MEHKKPNFILSIIPIILLILMIAVGVVIFEDNLTAGPSQIALLLSSLFIIIISLWRLKVPWEHLENGMMQQLIKAGPAIFILLMIGALNASWMLSGVVPTIVYYGFEIVHPSFFLVITFVLTAILSVVSGSSWTSIGTLGVAMITAGTMLGISPGWLAGAIISGAYFGDKRSPMSDSCNLSASAADVDLYKHISYLKYTNIPAFIVSLVVFTIAGFVIEIDKGSLVPIANMETVFNISPWLLIIPLITLGMIAAKIPAYITLFASAVISATIGYFVQPDIMAQISNGAEDGIYRFIQTTFTLLSSPVSIETGNELLNNLTNTRGMAGMMNTVWLILCVVAFGGVLDSSGMLNTITEKMLGLIKGRTSLVATTTGTGLMLNLAISDQYMSILLTGKMFSEVYKKRGYAPELLSRTLSDSAVVVSVLVPWNTCGVVQATVLGVSTLTYLPYCIFNIVSPIMSIIVAAINWKIRKIGNKEEEVYINK